MFTNSDSLDNGDMRSTHPASRRPLQLGTPRLHLKPRFESLRGGSNLAMCHRGQVLREDL